LARRPHGQDAGMLDDQHVIAECRSCRRLAHLGGGTLCMACLRFDETEIRRLTERWDHDLELLAQFEAYCAERSARRE
jgi:hypothetical protein